MRNRILLLLYMNNTSAELKEKYGEGKITEEICPKCGRQFECYTKGVFQSGEGGALQVYSEDSVFCNSCLLEEF